MRKDERNIGMVTHSSAAALGSDLVCAAMCQTLLVYNASPLEEVAVSPRSRRPARQPEVPLRILLASPDPDDHQRLPEILRPPHWRWARGRTCEMARVRLQRGPVSVLVCERDQIDGTWRDLLETASSLPQPPNVIVCSRLADESLWAEVLNLGGYDVLIKPFEPEEVARVVEGARRKWQQATAPIPLPMSARANGGR